MPTHTCTHARTQHTRLLTLQNQSEHGRLLRCTRQLLSLPQDLIPAHTLLLPVPLSAAPLLPDIACLSGLLFLHTSSTLREKGSHPLGASRAWSGSRPAGRAPPLQSHMLRHKRSEHLSQGDWGSSQQGLRRLVIDVLTPPLGQSHLTAGLQEYSHQIPGHRHASNILLYAPEIDSAMARASLVFFIRSPNKTVQGQVLFHEE